MYRGNISETQKYLAIIMKNLYDSILDVIESLDSKKSLYVLKGFNAWLEDMKIPSNSMMLDSFVIDLNSLGLEKIYKKLESGEALFCTHEQMSILSEKHLAGVPGSLGYKITVINNDFFNTYYPHHRDAVSTAMIQEQLDQNKDNIVQTYYGAIEVVDEIPFISYLDLHIEDCVELEISQLIRKSELTLDETSIEIPAEYNQVVFSSLIFKMIKENIGMIIVLDTENTTDANLINTRKRLEPIGIKFSYRRYVLRSGEISKGKLKAYTEILRRKNKNYDFYDIAIYADPYESNELAYVSQSEIIDKIVGNVEKSRSGDMFRDVFVTAPTGAGKSIMFQIPAIYLAEKFDLLTIIVSPLIGLMNDQVDNIKKLTNRAATINSDYTPAEREIIRNKVKKNEISMLYIAPETLLSNTDITNLIGEREIGLFVIDEAHIVATWGKSFRPDYWYLGDFIHKLRHSRYANHRFPIITFTATATFGGDDDMYQEIVESLKMTPTKYIGNIKRHDIAFDIRHRKKRIAYKEEKLEAVGEALTALYAERSKTLVYVPFRRHIDEVMEKLDFRNNVGKYLGGMRPAEKQDTLKSIKDGSKTMVIATKAFGMGIDIDDIKNIYHFAPTGNIADYVQEIGRVARKK